MAKYGTAYPPHSYLNQSKYSLNINKIPQATEKLLQCSDVYINGTYIKEGVVYQTF